LPVFPRSDGQFRIFLGLYLSTDLPRPPTDCDQGGRTREQGEHAKQEEPGSRDAIEEEGLGTKNVVPIDAAPIDAAPSGITRLLAWPSQEEIALHLPD
jgi:hypothetical protein